MGVIYYSAPQNEITLDEIKSYNSNSVDSTGIGEYNTSFIVSVIYFNVFIKTSGQQKKL